jgi:hypothetical protein
MTDKKTQLRKDEIMNAARAGISVVDGVLIIECDQQRFRITIHEE